MNEEEPAGVGLRVRLKADTTSATASLYSTISQSP